MLIRDSRNWQAEPSKTSYTLDVSPNPMQRFLFTVFPLTSRAFANQDLKGTKHRGVILSLLTVLGIPIPQDILETPAISFPVFLRRGHSNVWCGCCSWRLHAAAGTEPGSVPVWRDLQWSSWSSSQRGPGCDSEEHRQGDSEEGKRSRRCWKRAFVPL